MSEYEGLIEIPSNLETLQLPSPELLMYYKDLKNRVVWVEDIDCGTLEIIKLILKWNAEDKDIPIENRKPIFLMLFSYGGESDTCFSLISTIKLSKTPIHTVNMGVAASAGALIFIAGKKRYAMPESKLLLHGGSGTLSGTSVQVLDNASAYAKLIDRMKTFILENTTIPKATFTKYAKNEWTIDCDDFLKYGIADVIVSDIDEIL